MRPADALIIRALSRSLQGMSGRRVEQMTGSRSRSGTLTALDRLVRVGIVMRSDVGNAALYTLNRSHVVWDSLQRILEVRTLLDIELGRLVEEAFPRPAPTTAIFGSVAKGTSGIESDIDIVMVFGSKTPAHLRVESMDGIEESLRTRFGNAVEIIDIDIDQLGDLVRRDDPLVESWLSDSRTVAGPDLRHLIRNTPR